jgi:hypothetical protein
MSTTTVAIRTEETVVYVKSPFNRDFVTQAKNLGGRWAPGSKEWKFDLRDIARVQELCRHVYGTDGTASCLSDMVTLRVTVGSQDSYFQGEEQSMSLGGRVLAERRDRDWRVCLGEGVTIESGAFPGSGGSRKNPRIAAGDVVVLLVRDVPRNRADKWAADMAGIEVVESVDERKIALLAEAERLRERLAEIERELNPTPAAMDEADDELVTVSETVAG